MEQQTLQIFFEPISDILLSLRQNLSGFEECLRGRKRTTTRMGNDEVPHLSAIDLHVIHCSICGTWYDLLRM